MKSTLPLLTIALIFSSCTAAYKSGQTPDDVYYSPARPQVESEYVSQNNDNGKYYGSPRTYRDQFYDNNYSYNPNYYEFYNNSLYYNSPWNNYVYWNYCYNPYYWNSRVVLNYSRAVISRPRESNLNVYYQNNSKRGLEGNYYRPNSGNNSNNYRNSGTNAGNFLRNTFNNSGSSSNSSYSAPRTSSGSTGSSSSGGSTNAPVRKF